MPPNTPHLVSGIVKFPVTLNLVEGATVTVKNTRLDETLSTTTNSSGEYALDLANYTGAWTDGDAITVKASLGQRIQTTETTATGGSTTVNFTMTITKFPVKEVGQESMIVYTDNIALDKDVTITYNTNGTRKKVIYNYGNFTKTIYFTYDSKRRPIGQSEVVE